MSPFTRLLKSEDPLPLFLLNGCKKGVEAPNAKHNPVTPEDPPFPDNSGNPFDSSFSQDTSSDTKHEEEAFGQGTAAKSAAYASDEVYVENMWGELQKATPSPSGEALFHESTARVDKKLKGVADKILGKCTHTTYNIELQERGSHPLFDQNS